MTIIEAYTLAWKLTQQQRQPFFVARRDWNNQILIKITTSETTWCEPTEFGEVRPHPKGSPPNPGSVMADDWVVLYVERTLVEINPQTERPA